MRGRYLGLAAAAALLAAAPLGAVLDHRIRFGRWPY